MSEIKQVWGIIKDYQCADLEMVQGPALAVWNHQQAIVDDLKTQLNNMEQCYIQAKKERDELLSRVTKAQGCFQDFYSTGYHVHIFEADEALRGEHESNKNTL